jgi:modulator of FtsH protease
MNALELEGWHDFAVAAAGAAAALAGLIMVAISVNIKEIITLPGLPARAGATIAAVVVIVVAALVILIPGQSALALGLQLIAFAVAGTCFQIPAVRAVFRAQQGAPLPAKLLNAVLLLTQLVWIAVGGVIVALGSTDGLAYVAAGFVVIVITSMLNAWVLMVEILR